MAGNRSNQSELLRNYVQQDDTFRNKAPQSHVSGEKPVINEKWDFPDTGPLGENKQRKVNDPQPVQVKDTGDDISDDTQFKKGMRLFLMKRWENALQEFLNVETGDSEERGELAYYRGLCCTKLERFDDALPYFEQVVGSDDNPMRVYQCRLILAYIYIVTGRVKLAEAELNRLQAGGLESVMLYNTLAYSAYVQKHYMEAIEFYEKALELDQDNTTAMNSLGYVLADTGLDKFRGLRLCRKAVEKDSKNAAYLDSLGWALYKCGKLIDARNWLRQAMDIAPQEKEIKEHFRIVTREAM